MSISLDEARNKLDILEQIPNNPELILTKLCTNGVSGNNFLYQVNINGKYILDYIQDNFKKIKAVSNYEIKCKNCNEIAIYVKSINTNVRYNPLDEIIRIDTNSHTYRLIEKSINNYEKVMNSECILRNRQLSNDKYWNKFIDFSFKKRVKNSFKSLVSNKRLLTRLQDFVFWSFVSNKTILEALKREENNVKDINNSNLEQYNDDIKKQNYYLQYAPKHIEYIRISQKEISEYLSSLGYVENNQID